MINIKGMSKARVLAALANATSPAGLGWLQAQGAVTETEAQKSIDRGCADYCAGRPIKIDFSGDEIDPRLYDRDAGQGAAARVVDGLRATVAA